MFRGTALRRSPGDHHWWGSFLSSSASKSSSSGLGSVQSNVSALLQQPLPNRNAVLDLAVKNRSILLNSASWSLATPLSLLRLLYLFSNAGVGITGLSRSAGPTVMALLPSLTQKEVLSASVALLRLEGADALSSVPQEWINRLGLSLRDCTWINALEDVQLLASALALRRTLQQVKTSSQQDGNQPLMITLSSASARQLELALLRWTDELSPWDCIVFLHSLDALPVDQYLVRNSLQRRIRDALRDSAPQIQPQAPQQGQLVQGIQKKGPGKDTRAWGEVVTVLRGTVLEAEASPPTGAQRRGLPVGAPFRLTLQGLVVILEAYPFAFRDPGSASPQSAPCAHQNHAREVEILRLLQAHLESWRTSNPARGRLPDAEEQDSQLSRALELLSCALRQIRGMTKIICGANHSTLPLHPELLSTLLSLETGCEISLCDALVEFSKTSAGFEELLEVPAKCDNRSGGRSSTPSPVTTPVGSSPPPILLLQCLGLIKRSPLLILHVIASCGITTVHHIGRLSESSAIVLLKLVRSVIEATILSGQISDPSSGTKGKPFGTPGTVGPQVVTALLDGLAARLHLSAESDTLSLSQVIVVAKIYASLMKLVGHEATNQTTVESALSESQAWEKRSWLEKLDLGEGCTILLEKLLLVLHEKIVAGLVPERWSAEQLYASAHFVRAYLRVAKCRPHILWEPMQRKALLGLHGRCQAFVDGQNLLEQGDHPKDSPNERQLLTVEALKGLQMDLFEMGLVSNKPTPPTKPPTKVEGSSSSDSAGSPKLEEPEVLTKLELDSASEKERETLGGGSSTGIVNPTSTLVTPVKEIHEAPKIRRPTIRMKG